MTERSATNISVSVARRGNCWSLSRFFASYVIGPSPMTLQFWPAAVTMMLIATLVGSLVTNAGRSAWFVGALLVMVYVIFAWTLYLLPPRVQ